MPRNDEFRYVYHTCKARSCPSCGYRATLLWLREQWTQLPNVGYSGVVLTMPSQLWPIFQNNRHLLRDLPSIGAEAISLWMKEKYGVRPLILVVQHTFGRHLDFKPHLHMLTSTSGLSLSTAQWIHKLVLNHVAFMKLWRCGHQLSSKGSKSWNTEIGFEILGVAEPARDSI
jgi:hypothetical protein